MISGIGVDIVAIERLERALKNTPRLRERLFTENERDLAFPSLAARFAAKEALIKAVGNAKGLSFLEVEIQKDRSGKPSFLLSGESQSTIESNGIGKLHLTLSHDGGNAIAFVVAEG